MRAFCPYLEAGQGNQRGRAICPGHAAASGRAYQASLLVAAPCSLSCAPSSLGFGGGA